MLKLGGRVKTVQEVVSTGASRYPLFQLTEKQNISDRIKQDKALLIKKEFNYRLGKFKHIFILEEYNHLIPNNIDVPVTILPNDYFYLGEGDIVRLEPGNSRVRVLFRKNSPHNTILLTEQCNHYCLMCSQPPKDIDDSWLIDEALELVRMIPNGIGELGFSGGEPTLFGDRFLDVIELTAKHHNDTAIHILSNGRRFSNQEFTRKYSAIDHFDKMVGIPIYSHDPKIHNYVVQAHNAFDETVSGILNLKKYKQKVEIRVVLHKETIGTLVELAKFIRTNLLFVDHVALMGLEITGFTRANLPLLWIDPAEYKDELAEAVEILQKANMNTSIYNHPLCLVPERVRSAYKKSISDWKNEYIKECEGCRKVDECGGFFSSGVKHKHTTKVIPFN